MIPASDLPEQDPSRTGWEGTAGAPAAVPPPPETEDEDTEEPDDTARPNGEEPERPDNVAADEGTGQSTTILVGSVIQSPDAAGSTASGEPTAAAESAFTAGPVSAFPPVSVVEPVATIPPVSVVEPVSAAESAAGTDLASDDEAGWPDDPDALLAEDEVDAPAGAAALAEADVPVDAGTAVGDAAGVQAGTLADLSRAQIINAMAASAPGDQWSSILTMFVDDPRGSVLEAAALVDEAVDAFIATVRERQESLASSWEARGAGTEELRLALQSYRKFWSSLADLRQSA